MQRGSKVANLKSVQREWIHMWVPAVGRLSWARPYTPIRLHAIATQPTPNSRQTEKSNLKGWTFTWVEINVLLAYIWTGTVQERFWSRSGTKVLHAEAKCNPRHSFRLKDLAFLSIDRLKNSLQKRQLALLISTSHDVSNLEHIFQNNPIPPFYIKFLVFSYCAWPKNTFLDF